MRGSCLRYLRLWLSECEDQMISFCICNSKCPDTHMCTYAQCACRRREEGGERYVGRGWGEGEERVGRGWGEGGERVRGREIGTGDKLCETRV